MKRSIGVALVVGLLALAALIGRTEVRADTGGVPAEPVQAKPVEHGLKLWVFVHYAKDGDPGPVPGKGGGGPPPPPSCTDVNTQTGYGTPFAKANPSGLTFEINTGTIPSIGGTGDAVTAIQNSFATWNGVTSSYFSVSTGGSKTVPAQDGENEVAWANIVPKRVLAATWVWTDATNHVVEADVFYNNNQTWATLTTCGGSYFDVADIGTHEIGHAIGLSHYKDAEAQATMYPSAPAGEVRKTTLTAGDAQAFRVSLGP